jgi:hypothetical protein
MNSLLVALLFSFPIKFYAEHGEFIIESRKYFPTFDTISGGRDGRYWVEIQEKSAYICAKQDSAVTMVDKAWFINGKDTSKVEPEGLYNLDADHKHVQYVKHRKIGEQEYLFARFGPLNCPYLVAWKKQGKIYKMKEIFEPLIKFDLYEDEYYLDEWLKHY